MHLINDDEKRSAGGQGGPSVPLGRLYKPANRSAQGPYIT